MRQLQNIRITFYLILVTSICKAQDRSYDTVPYIMPHHNERLALFSHEPFVKEGIIFIGNSITEFGEWKTLLKDSAIVNRGIAGDITFGVLHRLGETIARQPAKLFIEIGINDMAKDIPDSVIVENIIAIVHRVKHASPTTQIFVQSILPINNALMTDYPEILHKERHIIKVNAVLMQRAMQNGFVYIDLYSRFTDSKGQLIAGYTTDGLHPNEAGYRLWVEILKKGKYL